VVILPAITLPKVNVMLSNITFYIYICYYIANFSTFYSSYGSPRGPLCISTPNSAEINPTYFEISLFFSIFEDGSPRHLGFWISRNFTAA